MAAKRMNLRVELYIGGDLKEVYEVSSWGQLHLGKKIPGEIVTLTDGEGREVAGTIEGGRYVLRVHRPDTLESAIEGLQSLRILRRKR